MNVHDNTQTQKMADIYREDGKVFVWAKAHGALTAKTPYKILPAASGWVTAAIADAASCTVGCAYSLSKVRIGAPEAAIASSAWGMLQVGGKITDLVTTSCTATVGYCIGWVAATAIATGAAYSGQVEAFGIFTATSAAATAHDVLLLNREVGCDST